MALVHAWRQGEIKIKLTPGEWHPALIRNCAGVPLRGNCAGVALWRTPRLKELRGCGLVAKLRRGCTAVSGTLAHHFGQGVSQSTPGA